MSPQHTAGWARALTAALARATGDTTPGDAARHLLTTGQAGPLNVNQGFAITKFPLPDGRVARPRLRVTELTAAEWDRVESAIRARPDAMAVAGTNAISDQLADPAHTAGIAIVPGSQDISHTCTCTPAAASTPCPHSVALGVILSERVRTAPGTLFTLRGRPHHHLKKKLRENGPAPQHAATPASGPPSPGEIPAPLMPAQTTRPAPPIPAPADLALTGARPVLTSSLTPPPAPLPGLPALRALAADAAHRAGVLLNGRPPLNTSEPGSDIARLLALPHGTPFREAAMAHLGLDIVSMGHFQLAYTHGGPGGAAAYLEPFTVDHDVLADAQARIQPLRPAANATIECEHNRLTDQAAGIQLRYGPDARWHPYLTPYGVWQPVPGSSADPAKAYRAARTAGRTHRRVL